MGPKFQKKKNTKKKGQKEGQTVGPSNSTQKSQNFAKLVGISKNCPGGQKNFRINTIQTKKNKPLTPHQVPAVLPLTSHTHEGQGGQTPYFPQWYAYALP